MTAGDGLPPPQRWRAVLVIMMGLTVAVLDGSIVNLALPGIARKLNAGASETIWVVNAYQIASLVLLLPLASLGDRFGYRRVYLVGMALFVLASAAAMMATSLTALTWARALQGLGAAGIMSVNTAMVRLIYPRARLGRGMAINSVVVATSTMAGPAVAAAILSVGNWPWLFALNVPLGLFTLWLGRQALPFNPPREHPAAGLSVLDVLLNTIMFTLVFIGADQLGGRGESANVPLGLTLLGAGVLAGGVLMRRQWHLPAPMFPVDLLRIPVFALSMTASLCAFCAQTLTFVSLPFLLLEVHGRSHLSAGLLMTAWPLAAVVMAPVVGRLIGRYADGWLGGIGMVVFATGLLLLAVLPDHPAGWDVAWRMALCGGGFALFQTPNNHTIVTSAPLHRSGAASGSVGTARLTGQSLGAVLLAAIYAVWDQHDGQGETVALLLGAGCALLAGVSSTLRVRVTPPR